MAAATPNLAAAFLARWGGGKPGALDATLDLDRALERVVESGRAAWPQLGLAPEIFAAHVAERLLPGEPLETALSALHAGDLYLACACAAGLPESLAAFDRILDGARPFIARVDGSPGFTDEVRQVLRERLLVAPPGRAPRIADYSGRGELSNWVGVAAQRAAISLRRREKATDELDDDLLDSGPDLQSTAEIEYLKARHKEDFKAALQEAFKELSDRERLLIKLYYVDGLNLHKLARLQQVNASTISRWLAAARGSLLDGVQRRLHERLRLSTGEFDSLARLVQSSLEVSLFRMLDDSAAQKNPPTGVLP